MESDGAGSALVRIRAKDTPPHGKSLRLLSHRLPANMHPKTIQNSCEGSFALACQRPSPNLTAGGELSP